MRQDSVPTSAIVFLAILAAGFVVTTAGFVGDVVGAPGGVTGGSNVGSAGAEQPGGALREALVDGGATDAIDERLEAAHPLRAAAVSASAAVRYLFFRQAVGEAVVGRDGWLFTLEEFERHADDEEVLADRLDEITSVAGELRERGIGLTVFLVPSKARLHPPLLPHRWRALAEHPRYDAAIATLRERGIHAVDLRDVFARRDDLAPTDAPAPGDEPLFYARDTHWTPAGARSAARALASALANDPESSRALIGVEPQRYEARVTGRDVVEGDLTSFVPVGERLRTVLGLTDESAVRYEAVPVADDASGATGSASLGLFDEISIPLALVGTSYSRDARWGFEEAIRIETGLDVLNVAAVGEGPFAPMREYLAGETIDEIPPEIVIWEIPERYLTLP